MIEDLDPLLQKQQHFWNLRYSNTSIVEILGGDLFFKVDRLNTKSYVLEFEQESPMVIEGQSLLPSPALTMPSATMSSARHEEEVVKLAEVSEFMTDQQMLSKDSQICEVNEGNNIAALISNRAIHIWQ